MKITKFQGSFEWDAEKERINIEKHQVNFGEACDVFSDPDRITRHDRSHSQDEQRWMCIGMVRGITLTVRYTIRIIGAGFWRKGRKFYEEKNEKKSSD